MVAIFLAKGFEEIEALTVCDLLRRVGVDVKLVSIDDTNLDASLADIDASLDDHEARITVLENASDHSITTMAAGTVSEPTSASNFVKVKETSTNNDYQYTIDLSLADTSNNLTDFAATGLATDKYVQEVLAWEVIK